MLSAAAMTRDLQAIAADWPGTVVFSAHGRTRAGFTVTDAIVGDIPRGERGEIDGIVGEETCRILLVPASCPYKPEVGQILTTGGVRLRIKTPLDDATATAYVYDCEAV